MIIASLCAIAKLSTKRQAIALIKIDFGSWILAFINETNLEAKSKRFITKKLNPDWRVAIVIALDDITNIRMFLIFATFFSSFKKNKSLVKPCNIVNLVGVRVNVYKVFAYAYSRKSSDNKSLYYNETLIVSVCLDISGYTF